ncbi:hypothetical protein A3768_1815 [Ralstonia solanacearum]|nr:hypothetical protein F504_1710 [Ralstonia pseudosolanacearum FQY_4]ANH32967.1 hypothetical protein A3768_1815 [Ralstonia solanacearum]
MMPQAEIARHATPAANTAPIRARMRASFMLVTDMGTLSE